MLNTMTHSRGVYARLELPDATDDGCDWAKAEQVLAFLRLMTRELAHAANALLPDVAALLVTVRAARHEIASLDALAGSAPVTVRAARPRRSRLTVHVDPSQEEMP